MSWLTPKTNWTAADGVTDADFNRIENNVLEVFNRMTAGLKTYRTSKDANGIFTTVEYKRADGTLALKSVLSGGTSPNYTTRTITAYADNGTTVISTTTRTLSYDADGAFTSEV